MLGGLDLQKTSSGYSEKGLEGRCEVQVGTYTWGYRFLSSHGGPQPEEGQVRPTEHGFRMPSCPVQG